MEGCLGTIFEQGVPSSHSTSLLGLFQVPRSHPTRAFIHNPCQNISLVTHIVGHHDGEEGLVGGVDGHVDGGGLQQDEAGVHEDVGAGQQEMERQAGERYPLSPERRGREKIKKSAGRSSKK